jgi:CopG family nickel-responsive transcriptional regulator
MADLIRMSVSLEQPLYEKLESLLAESRYSNRSEFVRDLIRGALVQRQWQSEQRLLGTITLIYDHHATGLAARLTRLQHDFTGRVLATTHVHLDHHHCAEMIMVRGRARCIQALADAMRREKGVLHAALATGTTGEELA